MDNEEKQFVEEHPEADFIAVVQVGSRGVKRFFTDKEKFNAYYDKAWESGHDMYSEIIRDRKAK